MSLADKQKSFTRAVGRLISFATDKGYELTIGDAYRDPRVHGAFGSRTKDSYSDSRSVHKLRLAIDLNLFINGEYIKEGDHIAWKDLGSYWESINPNATWGGHFKDANHFSFTHNGCK